MAGRTWVLVAIGLLLMTASVPVGSSAILPQDDAGSGQDAPDTRTPEVWIQSGETYSGVLEGLFLDSVDHYAFNADAGALVHARASGAIGCLRIMASDGTEFDVTCSLGHEELSVAQALIPATGTYYLQYSYFEAHAYRFSLGVDEAAPEPLPPASGRLLGPTTPVQAPASDRGGSEVVVAVIDSGINPYHQAFRAPGLTDHPSTYVEEFPSGAPEVDLTLDASDYSKAVAADGGAWGSMAEGNLYTFPGTRIIGGISFATEHNAGPVLDENGHGTATAGTVLHEAPEALVVMVQTDGSHLDHAVSWAASQPWIDVLSISWGCLTNCAPFSPIYPIFGAPGSVDISQQAWIEGKLVVNSAGNDPTLHHTDPRDGPPWVIAVGGANPYTQGDAFIAAKGPDVVANFTVRAPTVDSLFAARTASGTSFAAPSVAGTLANTILELRKATGHTTGITDGALVDAGAERFTNTDLRHAMNRSAQYWNTTDYDPTDKGAAVSVDASVPMIPGAPWLQMGWGYVDARLTGTMVDGLLDDDLPTKSSAAVTYMETQHEVRRVYWTGQAPALVGNDDAGTGEDAPDDPPSDVLIEPDTVYEGAFDGTVDQGDVYGLALEAGDTVTFAALGQLLCIDVFDPDGVEQDTPAACSFAGLTGEVTFTADETGTWFVSVGYFVPNIYSFGYGIDGPAPALGP